MGLRAGVEAVSARRWCDEFKVVIVLISPSGGKKEKEIGVFFCVNFVVEGRAKGGKCVLAPAVCL